MKYLVMPSHIDQIKNTISLCDGYIVGVENLSVTLPKNFSKKELEEIIVLCSSQKKEIFLALNKNMHQCDLSFLKEYLLWASTFPITGILYYDIAVVELRRELGIDIPLVWAQEHMTTNAMTSNYWYQFGAAYTFVSSEITIDEILEMNASTKAKLMVPIFGYLPMFVSKRHLVNNYLEKFQIEDHSQIHYMEKDGHYYPIIDRKDGTIAYSSHILNGIREVPRLRQAGIAYLTFHSFHIPEDLFLKILTYYREVHDSSIDTYEQLIKEQLLVDYGFLYKETIYKVKNYEEK